MYGPVLMRSVAWIERECVCAPIRSFKVINSFQLEIPDYPGAGEASTRGMNFVSKLKTSKPARLPVRVVFMKIPAYLVPSFQVESAVAWFVTGTHSKQEKLRGE